MEFVPFRCFCTLDLLQCQHPPITRLAHLLTRQDQRYHGLNDNRLPDTHQRLITTPEAQTDSYTLTHTNTHARALTKKCLTCVVGELDRVNGVHLEP